jgi:hypothetical protein
MIFAVDFRGSSSAEVFCSMSTIKVADFAPFPGGRYETDGPYSGEWFRETILRPHLKEALETGQKVIVVLEGAPGYGSSFLEEAFGGLIRVGAFRKSDLDKTLVLSAGSTLYEPFKRLVERYLREARFGASTPS